MERDPLQVAWAAGLFEGEGCFTATQQRKPNGELRSVKRVFARVASTDRDVLERFRDVVGFGQIYEHRRSQREPHWKPVYQWGVGVGHEVRELIDLLRPYLCARRAARAAEIYELSLLVRPHSSLATHCRNGHEYTAENTQTVRGPKGKPVRRCRTCRRADARRWEARQRTAA